MGNYYDGTKLLSLSDISGCKPELYLVTTNRTGGKTTYFSRLLVNRFLNKGAKFAILYRYNYELDNCADKFFKDINTLFFPSHEMTSKRKANGIFHELYLDEKLCGYAIALNSADQIKKYSHFFNDVDAIMFDEFQSETNHYCSNEVKKLISVHTSIARGQGKQWRYVPVYMIGNPVSMLNPYYIDLGISTRLKSETRFLRGKGYVMEQGYVQSACDAQKESGFNQAFEANSYTQYSQQSVYLNDSTAFIEKLTGTSNYLATIKYNGKLFSIKEYSELGLIYCDDSVDSSFKYKITVSADDHQINYVMLNNNDFFISNMRFYFEHGCFRFKNLPCKDAVLGMLSY